MRCLESVPPGDRRSPGTEAVEADKIRVVALGRQRSTVVPNVPSVVEAGFPDLVVETTSGFYGPASMALELRKRIAADVIAAAEDPTISQRIAATGQDMVPAGPEELAQTLKQQAANAAAVAKIRDCSVRSKRREATWNLAASQAGAGGDWIFD